MVETSGQPTVPSKMLGLELLRFGCAFAVLLWHYQHFYQVIGSPRYVIDAQPMFAVLAPFYRFGLFGVQMFWGISGFIFFWKYGNAIANSAVGAGKFFWLRFSRLYPLHLLSLLAVAALQPVHVLLTGQPFIYHGNTPSQFVLNLFMATQWSMQAPYSFNGPIWSVSAEVFVYALFFLLVRRFGNSLAVTAAMVLASLVAGMMQAVTPIVACASYFFAGGLAAQLFERVGEERGARGIAAGLLALLVGGAAWNGWLTKSDANPLLILFGLPPLLFLLARDPKPLERFARPIEIAGNLTYSTYLCHFPLQLIVAVGVAASGIALPVASAWFLAAYLGVTMAVGYVVFERFERPAQDTIRGWARRRQTLPA